MKNTINSLNLLIIKISLTGLFLISGLFFSGKTNCQPAVKNSHEVLETNFYNGTFIRIRCLKENIVRIQITQQKGKFRESGLSRYGFINDLSPNNLKVNSSDLKNNFSVETSHLKLKGNKSTGKIVITDPSGKKIHIDQIAANFADSAAQVVFRAGKEEDWIGFGDQTRGRIYHRGYIADCNVRNVKSYIAVPFFMSTVGTGVLVNTSHRVVFDMCKSDPDKYSWSDGSGSVDYYVITGNGFKELIDLYTELTGKPKLPPEWSFGLWYICRTQANDYEAVNDALNFRREEIPCDVIGLEPGWMEKNYDYSTSKAWSKDRFPIPSYSFKGTHNFMNSIDRMGFKFELWLCNDYDLSYEEERRLMNKGPVVSQKVSTGKPSDIVEIDGHLVKETSRKPALSKDDKLAEKEEPWFDHLKKFIDQGVDFFKQDGSKQVVEHKGKIWGNGMPDAEMHNLYPLFYSRQMYEGFKAYTNRRPVVFTPAGWTGFQAWSGTWTGDTGGRLSTLGAMINTSIVGHSWSTNDMEVTEKEGIHFGYLQPWSQINSWNYFRMPWIQGAELTAMHRFYAQLRSRLIPYLYSWAYYATKTGWPLLIPLTMEFPEDINCRENLHQYLLGRDIMVGIYKKNIYFPAGQWKDFWTGEVISGLQEREIIWPEDRGGALYVRSGGIIALGPVMQYRGEKPIDEITLYVFPDKEGSSFKLYEDDGVSFEHLDGKYSTTTASAKLGNEGSVIEIGASEGNFKGKVENRKWNIIMHADTRPGSVKYNDKPCSRDNYSWDESRKELTIKGIVAPALISVN